MSLIKCPECGKEISDLAEKCPNCGFPIKSNNSSYPGMLSNNHANTNMLNNNVNINPQQGYVQPIVVKPYQSETKNSKLGIAALILSILGCTFWLGIILAVVDLCKKDGSKKVCSVVAICVSIFWLILAVSVGRTENDSSTQATNSVNTTNTAVVQGENISNQQTQNYEAQEENEREDEVKADDASILVSGTYIAGEDIDSGKYNFEASKGTGTLYLYNSYEDYRNDEYGFDALRSYDMLADGASVGLLNEDVYTDSVYNIRIEDGQCLVIDKGLEVYYEISEYTVLDELGVGVYVAGEDIEAGKYDLTAIAGSGSVALYNSYEDYLNDKYGFDAFESYDMKEENASVGMLNEDVYTQSVSNVRIEEGQCLIIEKGLKIKFSPK